MTASAASAGATSGSATSRPSHSPTSSQRSNVHGRAARAQASGSLQRPCGCSAGPRGESISPGIQEARASPQRPGQSRPVAERLDGRDDGLAATVGLVVGVRPRAIADAGPEVGGVGAVGEVDHGSAVSLLDGRPWAPLGARVLGVDGLDRLAGVVQAHLHHLPVARVAARAQDPAILVVRGERQPPLDPVAGPAVRTLWERPKTSPDGLRRNRAERSRASRARRPGRAGRAWSEGRSREGAFAAPTLLSCSVAPEPARAPCAVKSSSGGLVAAAAPAARATPSGSSAERDHEGTTVGQADVREVQDHPPPRTGPRHLPEPATQAAAGVGRRWLVSQGSTSPSTSGSRSV